MYRVSGMQALEILMIEDSKVSVQLISNIFHKELSPGKDNTNNNK